MFRLYCLLSGERNRNTIRESFHSLVCHVVMMAHGRSRRDPRRGYSGSSTSAPRFTHKCLMNFDLEKLNDTNADANQLHSHHITVIKDPGRD